MTEVASETIEQIAPDRLKSWARNARTHSKKQLRQIADSIRAFGFTNPVLIDEKGSILAGHGRVADLRMMTIPRSGCCRGCGWPDSSGGCPHPSCGRVTEIKGRCMISRGVPSQPETITRTPRRRRRRRLSRCCPRSSWSRRD